jgi:hypothetical protein
MVIGIFGFILLVVVLEKLAQPQNGLERLPSIQTRVSVALL